MCDAKIARFIQRLEDRSGEKKSLKHRHFYREKLISRVNRYSFFSICAKLFQLCFSVRCWSTQKKKQQMKNVSNSHCINPSFQYGFNQELHNPVQQRPERKKDKKYWVNDRFSQLFLWKQMSAKSKRRTYRHCSDFQ